MAIDAVIVDRRPRAWRPTWRRTASGRCTAPTGRLRAILRCGDGDRRGRRVQAAGSVVVMAGGTNRGNEVMARVATQLDVAMAANVVSFGGLSPFVVTRQVVGGAALEEVRLSQRPAVFTVAGHAVEPTRADAPAPAPCSHSLSSCPRPTSPCAWSRCSASRTPTTGGSGRLASSSVPAEVPVDPTGSRASSSSRTCSAARSASPGGHLAGLAPAQRAGRPDRQPDLPRRLHPLRHQRRDPALGRLRPAPR